MTAEQRAEAPAVEIEPSRTEVEIIGQQGYIITTRLMRVSAMAWDGPRYDALEAGWTHGPAMPQMGDETYLDWMFLGELPNSLPDPLNPEGARKVGAYLFYDPKRIQTASQYDLEHQKYDSEEEWQKRRERWTEQGWVPLDRGPEEPVLSSEAWRPGDYFIRRTPQRTIAPKS